MFMGEKEKRHTQWILTQNLVTFTKVTQSGITLAFISS